MLDSNKLKGRMAAAGVNQKELAAMIKMSINTLSNKIRGNRDFTVSEIDCICDALGIVDNSEKAQIFLSRVIQ